MPRTRPATDTEFTRRYNAELTYQEENKDRGNRYTQKLAETDADGTVWETHVYDGPQGTGWALIVTNREADTNDYIKATATGAEASRLNRAWSRVEEPEI